MNDFISSNLSDRRQAGSRLAQQKSSLDCNISTGINSSVRNSHSSGSIMGQDPVQVKENNASLPQAGLQGANKTGLPDHLKDGIEDLSGLAMDDLKVHYNSDKPAQLNAHAYAQGRDIHVAPGQEQYLPHEAWHVVQQMQGRVNPTSDLNNKYKVNDDPKLEKEADIMGNRAMKAERNGQKADQEPSKSNGISSPAEPVVQRVISYKRGGYKDQKSLEKALCAIFDAKAHKKVKEWVQKYEDAKGRALFASTVYEYVIGHMADEGFSPTFATTTTPSSSSHGPMLPDRVNRHAPADPEKALSTFNFSSVTLGRLTMITGRNRISFQDRQLDANFHAEDGLMEQMAAYLKENKIDTTEVRLNLTINNFFCNNTSTTKKRAGDNCLDEIIALQQKYKFAGFHVYFQNTYGDPHEMTNLIKRLQAVGIKVSSFTTKKKAPYVNDHLDSHSESEEEEHKTFSSVKKRSYRKMGHDHDRDEQFGGSRKGMFKERKVDTQSSSMEQ